MPLMIKHVRNRKRKRKFRESRQKEAKKQMDIFNSVKTTYAQAAAATKPVVKTATVEMQTEMTWPDGSKLKMFSDLSLNFFRNGVP